MTAKRTDARNIRSGGSIRLVIDPAGGLYVAESVKNRVVHYSGTSTTPDRVYGAGSTPNTGPSAGGQPAPLPTPTPVPTAAPVAAAPAPAPLALPPNWSDILFNEHDGRISAGACETPDPRGLGRDICINYKYDALDQATYADLLGDGGIEAVIPLDSGGPLDADSSIVYPLDGFRPRLIIADGPGGVAYADTSSGLFVSAAPDPAAGCSSLDCPAGLVRTNYRLIGDLLALQGACTHVPDPNDARAAQGDCTPVPEPSVLVRNTR